MAKKDSFRYLLFVTMSVGMFDVFLCRKEDDAFLKAKQNKSSRSAATFQYSFVFILMCLYICLLLFCLFLNLLWTMKCIIKLFNNLRLKRRTLVKYGSEFFSRIWRLHISSTDIYNCILAVSLTGPTSTKSTSILKQKQNKRLQKH